MSITRKETIARIKAALKRRSGKPWSVTGGRGTAWAWLKIDAPPKRCTWKFYRPEGALERSENYQERDEGPEAQYGHMSPDERSELGRLLGIERIHHQGESVPPGEWERYVDLAETGKTDKPMRRDWDWD